MHIKAIQHGESKRRKYHFEQHSNWSQDHKNNDTKAESVPFSYLTEEQ